MRYPDVTGGGSAVVCRKLIALFPSILITVLLFIAVCSNAQESLSFREAKYETIIQNSAKKHGVDPMLVKAIIFTESTFFSEKEGKAGEIGLMQIRTAAAADWAAKNGVTPPSSKDMYQPELNIEIGTWYISRALKRWYKDPDFLRMGLAEYNAGRSRLLEWMARYNNDTDMVLEREPVGKYVSKVCRKYVEYVICAKDPEVPSEKVLKIAEKEIREK